MGNFDDYDEDDFDIEDDDDLYDDSIDEREDDFDDDYLDDDLGDDIDTDANPENHGNRDGRDLAYYEDLGIEDGRFDKDHHMLPQSSFGSSVDLNELTDDEREAYEIGYTTGAEDYDLSDND